MVKAEELRDMSAAELSDKIQDFREQLFKLRFQQTTGAVENAGQLRTVRRDLARALTVQSRAGEPDPGCPWPRPRPPSEQPEE